MASNDSQSDQKVILLKQEQKRCCSVWGIFQIFW